MPHNDVQEPKKVFNFKRFTDSNDGNTCSVTISKLVFGNTSVSEAVRNLGSHESQAGNLVGMIYPYLSKD